MDDRVDPADAARALGEIGRRREQVIRRNIFPGWYWWAHAVLIVAIAAVIESGRGVLIWIGIPLYVAGALAVDVPVRCAARAAAPRRSVTEGSAGRTLLGLAAFVAVLLGVLLATAFSLRAAGVPHPVTIAATVAAVVFAVGGPMLVRLGTAMVVRRSGSQG